MCRIASRGCRLSQPAAVAMPALAVVVLWLTSSEGWLRRVRLVAPAVLLVIPLVAYLGGDYTVRDKAT